MKALIICAMLIFYYANANAGPFGTNMGDTTGQYSNLVQVYKDDKNTFATDTVPNKHGDFQSYLLVFSQTYGLVRISAMSNPIRDDEYGNNTRVLFAKIKDQLCKKYGKEKKFYDFLKNGSIWKEDKYWSTGIRKHEREYSAFWELKDNEDKISFIRLKVLSNPGQNTLLLTYEYIDAKKHYEEKKQEEAGAL